jgi:LmbE family N-acetylglucosaminyl deacetylase
MQVINNHVLAVGAHPDDVEFMCAGTLKLLKEKGYAIHIAVVANGDLGSNVEGPEAITKIRRKEALDAASLLKAKFYPLGERDLRIEFDEKTKMKVTECIRMVNPLIVFTHPHEDYVVDHEITSKLVQLGCFAASIPNYLTYSDMPHDRTSNIPYLYYWSPLEGKNIYGDFIEQRIYVNITNEIELKSKMLACHKSQRDWMRELGMDKYIDSMKNTAKKYGNVSGFNFAEGFMQHSGSAYPQGNILKEILSDFIKERQMIP